MKVRLTNHLDKEQDIFSLVLNKNGEDGVTVLVDQYKWSELSEGQFNDIMRYTIKMNEALEKLWH